MKIRIAPALVVAVLFGVTCGDDDDDSVADESQALCESMQGLQSTVDQVAGAQVDLDSITVGDVQDALQSLQGQVEDVQNAEATLATEVRSSLQSAWSDFTSGGAGHPGGRHARRGRRRGPAARTQFQEAWSATLSQLNCGTTTATT